jgi:hypothetical protein
MAPTLDARAGSTGQRLRSLREARPTVLATWQHRRVPQVSREDERYERWLGWLKGVDRDVTQLALDRFVFQRLGEITHAAELPASYLFDALNYWYVRSQATAVRRQCEVHRDAASLASLLDQIRAYPNVLTRSRYVGLCVVGQDDQREHARYRQRGHEAFDGLAGQGNETIPAERIEADLQRLADVAEPVKRFVDRLVAHWDRRGLSELPTFADLNAAIDVIGEVYRDWSQWLTAQFRAELVPAFQYDWEAPLRVAWLR